ncbi:MAG: hypothetical protein M3R38_34495 [Actinomycetota bacterium]|nr:hypothetical protein [Actinomycetota bacterium]
MVKVAMVSKHASPLAALGNVDAGGQNRHVPDLAAARGRRGEVVCTRREEASGPERATLAFRFTVEHVDAGSPGPVLEDLFPAHVKEFASEPERPWEEGVLG